MTADDAREPVLQIDPITRCLRGPGGTAALTAKECDLLTALMRAHGGVVSRQHLLAEAWGGTRTLTRVGASRSLDVHIATLRGKLGASGGRDGHRIDTVRGIGYRLVAPSQPAGVSSQTGQSPHRPAPD